MVNSAPQEEKLYLRIAKSLEDDILAGIIREGEPVPSTNHYANYYKINPATVAKGVARLTNEGILYKKRGVGMFVGKGSREKILERRRADFRVQYFERMLDEARRIGISKSDLVAMIMSYE